MIFKSKAHRLLAKKCDVYERRLADNRKDNDLYVKTINKQADEIEALKDQLKHTEVRLAQCLKN